MTCGVWTSHLRTLLTLILLPGMPLCLWPDTMGHLPRGHRTQILHSLNLKDSSQLPGSEGPI